ncbi:Acetyltransferase (GNAT) family protein [Asanoa ishikariensis]|uniref:Acetyltransferase (GNAT) family protein n=1 Tax=Asanoa ishikariensis TaxID=137265 RepID=A0A1H3RSE3_9ACTN|nr:GNAT family N-acetyltransferase [Asanoa ishikariensis]SDZ28617.1 Acetyltransferase (GNAT) family protein [Asanoa ishikariensis]
MVEIELAQPEDAGEVLTLQRAAFLTEAQRYDNPHLPMLTETLDEITAVISGPGTLLVGRTARGRLVAVGRGRLDEHGTCHLARLAVAPDLRGRGLGWRILVAIEAAHPKALRFELFTGAESHDNIRLYERNGYKIFDRRLLDRGPGLVYLAKPAVR